MTDPVRPAVIAVLLGLFIAAVMFIPFVAVQYRRHGRPTLRWTLVTFSMLVYALALISYTLLPLPVITAGFCAANAAAPQLIPGRFIADIVRENANGSGSLLRNPALLQVLLNIGLFVPLGVFLRRVFHRGILVTTLIGFGVSALIEVTQLTGVWFAFPCAYRLFDVDDLFANMLGALAGALIAPAVRVVRSPATVDREAPTGVSAWRRLLGMFSDVAFLSLAGGVLASVFRLIVEFGRIEVPEAIDVVVIAVLGTVVPAAVQLVVILATGRSVGEVVVRLRPATSTTRGSRFLRWAVGIGGYSVLSGVGGLFALLTPVLVIATVVAVFRSRGHRGLAYAAAGWHVADDRAVDESVVVPPPDNGPRQAPSA